MTQGTAQAVVRGTSGCAAPAPGSSPGRDGRTFGAQLLTIVRGVYYDGWKPAETPVKMSNEEFFARVRSEFPYAVEGGNEKLVRTVLKTLERHVSAGEWQHLKSRLPNSFAALLP
ncbi:DUF2267 domain-containing protein [Streptomyces sp. IB201691-2A2]|uniref:DUF2267 domain-containing protein n=1 Tax=Streptomyces sp. IB201691-2A2 TaxID=2561920 RepID=UPI0021B11B6F|nr:DUF2267 domain-containing protein [Streptomyces sp. IB201691-2A2]